MLLELSSPMPSRLANEPWPAVAEKLWMTVPVPLARSYWIWRRLNPGLFVQNVLLAPHATPRYEKPDGGVLLDWVGSVMTMVVGEKVKPSCVVRMDTLVPGPVPK